MSPASGDQLSVGEGFVGDEVIPRWREGTGSTQGCLSSPPGILSWWRRRASQFSESSRQGPTGVMVNRQSTGTISGGHVDRDVPVDEEKVCVFGGLSAWPFYRRTAAYVCQPNRFYQADTARIAFYSQRTIFGAAPLILEVFPEESLDDETIAGYCLSVDPTTRHLGLAMAAALEDEGREDWVVQVMLLSAIDDPRTVTFDPIHHEGRGPWTRRQRYTRLDQLTSAKTTTDLGEANDEE